MNLLKSISPQILLIPLVTLLTSCSVQSPDQAEIDTTKTEIQIGEIVPELGDSLWYIFQDSKNNYWFGSNGEGEDGIKRYRTEIVVENMIMLDRKGDAMGEGAGYDRQAGGLNNEMPANNSSAPAVAASAADDITIDDLPF